MFDPSDTVAIGIGITAFVGTIMSVFMFMTAGRERPARLLGYAAAAIAAWSWIGFGYHLVDSVWVARELRILSIVAQLIAQVIALRFVLVYLEQVRPATRAERWYYRVLMGGNTLFISVFVLDMFGTHLAVGDLSGLPPDVLSPEPGPFMFLFLLFYYLLACSYGYFLYQRIRLVEHDRERADTILAIGMVAAFFMGGIGFATWYDITGTFTLLRGLAVPFFVVAMFYSITNYQLFNLRVAAAEVFVFAMWGFMFLRILMQPSLAAATPDIIILVAFIVAGLLLIRNVTKELEARIELEEVSEELRKLNNTLGEKVKERTYELARAQEHVEHMVERLPVGLVEINDRDEIVRMNNVAARLLRVPQEKSLGKQVRSYKRLCTLIGDNLTPGVHEVQLDASPTAKRDIEVMIAPLLLEDSSGHVIITRDVTERRALERAKNEFIATAAHQLRTPLSAIKWTFELLKGGSLEKQQKEVLARGEQGIVNLEQIAEALMLSIRTAQGTMSYSFEQTTLTPIFENVVAMVTPLAEKRRIDLATDVPDTLPTMRLDTERIGFAIQNLLDNAIKYTPEGGAVTLTVTTTADAVTIKVSDTGIGMSAEEQEHLFEKFFRARRATEMATDGSGLGLVIVKSIVNAHDGTITVDSKPDQGTTFTITLPVHTDSTSE